MKKVFYSLVVLVLFGCEELTPVPETFTFTVNGTEMDFSENITVSENLFTGEVEITGKKTGVGKVIITLHETGIGEFNENDYLYNDNDFTSNYKLRYVDNNEDSYSYYSSCINEWFIINIKKFENRIDGEVSGKFSGRLVGTILNNSSAIDSVVIENGNFSTQLNDKID